jgi:spermidine synthase
MIVHLPMAVHQNAKRVLIIGGGDGGALRELCKYKTLESIDIVEIDKKVVDVCKEYLPFTACGFDDARVNVFYQDGLKFVRKSQNDYDLIIVDSTDPLALARGFLQKSFTGIAIKP